MTRTRDDFSAGTKNALALRASFLCSLCKCSTVGPSDESSGAVTRIGVAAHICAAASGPGARRYNAAMTAEERSHIDNGIWLCASCATLIDRDEVRFPVDDLHRVKREHESSRRIRGTGTTDEGDIVAIGPDIIAVGRILRSGLDGTRIRLSHFVNGSGRDLWSLTQEFSKWPPERRYVLINELGFGALLAEPPTIERADNAYDVHFRLQDQVPRRDATANISTMCRETGTMIHGIDAYIRNFESALSLSHGTWFACIDSGSDLSDLYWRYKDSPWFERLAMMEMIRLSSIPNVQKGENAPSTPFLAVNRVNRVEVPTFEIKDQMLDITVQFELEGMGIWDHTLSVFISTPEQLASGRVNARQAWDMIKEIEGQSR